MDKAQAQFKLHEGLPRCGPGSDHDTELAMELLPPLPKDPRIVDLGCGNGRQTLLLARRLGPVEAVDIYQPYLNQLQQAAAAEDLADRITTRCADMAALDYEPESIDLIWSECSIHMLGFEQGLKLWRPFLKLGGLLMVSDLTWMSKDRSSNVADFWGRRRKEMGSMVDNLMTARKLGYQPVNHFLIQSYSWWDDYYLPLMKRIELLRPLAEKVPAMASAIRDAEMEIAVRRQYGHSYGCVYYIFSAK